MAGIYPGSRSVRGVCCAADIYAARELLGRPGLALIGITATAAVLSSVIGFYRATNRILSNMADDGILNRFFSKPGYCYVFIMSITVVMSLMGRKALAWFVDLSSIGAITGFGYASAVVLKMAKSG